MGGSTGGVGTNARSWTRIDGFGLVLGVLFAWMVLVAVFGVSLFIENNNRTGHLRIGCPVPGGFDSTYGHGVWQAWPPGTRCERRGQHLDVASTTPQVWDRPSSWRSTGLLLLAGSGGAIAVALWKEAGPRPLSRVAPHRQLLNLDAGGRADAEIRAVEGGRPSGLVHDVMMVVTEQHEIVEIGWPVVLPMDDVMGITPPGGLSTPWISTSVIPDDQRPAHSIGHSPVTLTDVDREALRSGHDPRHGAVTQQLFDVTAMERPGVLAVHPPEFPILKRPPIDHHRARRPRPRPHPESPTEG